MGIDLRRFLVGLPRRMSYDDDGSKAHLYKVLYYLATNNGKLLQELFPDIANEDLELMLNFSNLLSLEQLQDVSPFYRVKSKSQSLQESYSHPPGQPCARLFKFNDPVYRCEDCGFDDTCVLCTYCFNEADHLGHNVTMYTSQGTSGGICDCGDPEAFVNPLNCKCSTSETKALGDQKDNLDSNTIDFQTEQLLETFKICFEYILDVTNLSILTLPMVHELVKFGGFSEKEWSDYSSMPEGRYGEIDVNSQDKWYLILWNDEFHDVNQAVESIKSCKRCNDDQAIKLATKIDKEGYAILLKAENYRELTTPKFKVEAGGLVSTIVSARDYMRSVFVRTIFSWFEDCLNSKNKAFQSACRAVVTDLLADTGYSLGKKIPELFFLDATFGNDLRERYFANGLPINNEFTVYSNSNELKTFPKSHHSTIDQQVLPKPFKRFSRLQFLLIFQIRLAKPIRQALVPIIIPSLVSHDKQVFAQQFTEIYPTLLTILARSDREDDLNLIDEIAAQLYTCPVTVPKLIKSVGIGYILSPVISIIENCSSEFEPLHLSHRVYKFIGDESHIKRTIQAAIIRGIRDFGHFTSSAFSKEALAPLMEPANVFFLIRFIQLFQGYLPLTRKYGDHVEHELYLFQFHLIMSIQILKSLQNLAFSQSDNLLADAVAEHLPTVASSLEISQPQLHELLVWHHPHGLVYPITSYLSFLIQSRGFDKFVKNQNHNKLEPIADHCIWNIVMASQIKIGLWIRNGVGASRQASMYFGTAMSELTFRRDLHILQVALMTGDASSLVRKMLERWELYEWFLNECAHDGTMYEERFFSIIEMFLWISYILLTDRTLFIAGTTPTEQANMEARRIIAYRLCDLAKSYSELKTKCGSLITSLPEFDSILSEIAEYQPPSSFLDLGHYRLKSSMYKQLDPMSVHLNSTDFHSISEVMARLISKQDKIKEEDVIFQPVFLNSDNSNNSNNSNSNNSNNSNSNNNENIDQVIGLFAKTRLFVKLLYKLLQLALDTSNETYLPQLLHLLHAIVLDDEIIHGKDYLNQYFVELPICDLLVTIVESKMSKTVRRKADYILDQFLAKDTRIYENLVSCFGEEYVERFIKGKQQHHKDSHEDAAKKKSEARKRKIMKKFAKRQEQFLRQNSGKDGNDNVDADTVMKEDKEGATGKPSLEEGADGSVCVMCGEAASPESTFGCLMKRTFAPIFWKYNDPKLTPCDVWNEDLYDGADDTNYGKGYDVTNIDSKNFEKPVLSTCGHGVHLLCLRRVQTQRGFTACPLCRNYHDLFIPILRELTDLDYATGDVASDISSDASAASILQYLLYTDFQSSTYLTITAKNNVSPKLEHLRKLLIPSNASYTLDYYADLFPEIKKGDLIEKYIDELINTIEMNEIATRLNGTEGFKNFSSQVPNSAKTLLRSLLQAVVLLPRSAEKEDEDESDSENENETPTNIMDLTDISTSRITKKRKYEKGVFSNTVNLFFNTNESLASLVKIGICETLAIVMSRVHHTKHHDTSSSSSYFGGDIGDVGSLLSEFEQLWARYCPNSKVSLEVYKLVKQIICIYLRRVVLFQDILLGHFEGEDFISSKIIISELDNFEQTALLEAYSLTQLESMLRIPTLDRIIGSIVSFESSMEKSAFETVFTKTASNHLPLEYPGVIHLTTLPKDYQNCLLRLLELDAYNKMCCLICGTWIAYNNRLERRHHVCANKFQIYFKPKECTIHVYLLVELAVFPLDIPAPYLTKHGEIKTMKDRGKAMLGEFRFKELNKLWINQGLYALLTRTMFGPGVMENAFNVLNRGRNFLVEELGLNDQMDLEEDDDDDDEEFITW